MQGLNHKAQELTLKINTEGLSPLQVRLIKSIHALVANVLAADEESEYFDASAELMKKTAELVKHANFALKNNTIAYGNQAVEFATDNLIESMDENKIQNLDN